MGPAIAAVGAWICVHAGILLRTRGNGLPISALPPTRFVTTGPYRYWTHPIYTGYLLLIAGLGLLFKSPGTSLVVAPVMGVLWFLTWVKLYEEPGLLRRFGAEFRAHRKRTGIILPFRMRNLARALFLLAFKLAIRVRVAGADNAPAKGPVLFVSDHLSYFDLILGHITYDAPITIPVTAEVFRSPLRRLFLWILGAVPKRRFCSDPETAQVLSDELSAGKAVGIAVEGERSWTGEMGKVASGVAWNIGWFDVPVVPVAFTGSYRLWPRWAGGPNRKAQVVVRVGKPFLIRTELDDFVPGDPARSEEIARLLEKKIAALREPNEASVDLSAYPSVKPQLVLWTCPICGAEESLSMQGRRYLTCSACYAKWDTLGGDLTLVEPSQRRGEKDTLAGWASRIRTIPNIHNGSRPLIESPDVELREEPHARAVLDTLHSLGTGNARLFADRIEWKNGVRARVVRLADVRSVTTERNDTLQLGTRQEVIQLVMNSSSPLRWKAYLAQIKEASHVQRSS
jgi:1-acyl-sn-glycerol-3-phosphate acyltransferase